jgi:hypothetical protein
LAVAGTATLAVAAGFGVFVAWLRSREALQKALQTAVNPRKDDRP